MGDVYGSGLHERLKQITDAVSSKYKCSVKWLVEPGDCISFLKRSYELVVDGEEQLLVIRPHPRHVERLVLMLSLASRKCKPTPMPSSLHPDHEPLSSEDAWLFRSATGILLYLGPDTSESQNAIRLLAQQMANPTLSGMHLLKHVVCYLKGVTGYGIAFNVPTIGNGIVTRGRSRTFLGRRLVSRLPDTAECLVRRAGIQRTRCGNELEDPTVRKPLLLQE